VDVANTCNNRGIALGQLGRYEEAIAALQQALQARWHLVNTSSSELDPPAAGASAASAAAASASNNKSATGAPAHDSIISTLHNIANVHQQAGQLDDALQVLGQARDLAQERFSNTTSISRTMTTLIPTARLCVAMGHVYSQVEQWVDARDAYLDAIEWYRRERGRQQELLRMYNSRDKQVDEDEGMEALSAAILTTQQELSDVQRDLEDILRRLLVSPYTVLWLPPRVPRALAQP
jgi:tetratricopeptide (TPR) repeat protein